ncbi:PadR family transcriptional regulator [Mycobacterium sp. CBMA293]|uniref:PadR family transcriptional regulator n=1 Tax=unclassified Mycolicibacterium TaxID=2636767 RepID=UPI0012DC55A5|nr:MULTISPECIES: PadR family transcriptional regulator [unclassified Mycolicibacterium]MUL47285.1 PadR family transcriptional regulator [Mycolicibacterium sp. CBMA 360]MUL61396.1 PadR family transcriptional regulator [Mycolicibacterium sp. CBMA 335]MUL72131.1 PadR family transcriptional regulator [Mycolicibacterium sp. CBMA 311]MUL96298.1 PadR family transcriptional regulator [Mycolicibacterium sp. CBMA 230]MUM08879.1 PadR family transcriptional regulator [Mycolicibacterium sp. CBMA 213]
MALRDAVLAALLDSEASGYDLAKGFDASVANFWMATPQQLYRELDRLAADGLIEARVVEQERRPNKRMFTLTDAGRAAVHEFTEATPKPLAMRDDLLVQVSAVDGGNPDAVCTGLRERIRWTTEQLERYERMRNRLLSGRSEAKFLAEADRVGPYLTLMRGISFEQENLRWAQEALAVIERRLSRR